MAVSKLQSCLTKSDKIHITVRFTATIRLARDPNSSPNRPHGSRVRDESHKTKEMQSVLGTVVVAGQPINVD